MADAITGFDMRHKFVNASYKTVEVIHGTPGPFSKAKRSRVLRNGSRYPGEAQGVDLRFEQMVKHAKRNPI